MKKTHSGSNFDDCLQEDGLLAACERARSAAS
jgi:hypothetical protein